MSKEIVDFADENIATLRFQKKQNEETKQPLVISPSANLNGGKKTLAKVAQGTGFIPPGLMTYTVVIHPENVICFYGYKSFLSNYFSAPILIDGVVYATVEHYYQSCKLYAFGGQPWLDQIKLLTNPADVKAKVKVLTSKLDKKEVNKWKVTKGFLAMEVAINQKFTQHPRLTNQLLATGDCLLVHSNPYETLWAAKMNEKLVKAWITDRKGSVIKIPQNINSLTISYLPSIGNGQNALGYILMQTRNAIRKSQRLFSFVQVHNYNAVNQFLHKVINK